MNVVLWGDNRWSRLRWLSPLAERGPEALGHAEEPYEADLVRVRVGVRVGVRVRDRVGVRVRVRVRVVLTSAKAATSSAEGGAR